MVSAFRSSSRDVVSSFPGFGQDEASGSHIFGEDASPWLAVALAVVGATLAFGVGQELSMGTVTVKVKESVPAHVPAGIASDGYGLLEKPGDIASGPPTPGYAFSTATESGVIGFSGQADVAATPAEPPAVPVVPAAPAAVSVVPAAPVVPVDPAAPSSVAPVVACLPVVSIPFIRDSSRLPSGKRLSVTATMVAPLLEWLESHRESVVLVEGHADSTGTEPHNIVLSYARARAVSVWLARIGVPSSRMSIRAAGTGLPFSGGEVVAENRQALIRIEGVDACHAVSEQGKTP